MDALDPTHTLATAPRGAIRLPLSLKVVSGPDAGKVATFESGRAVVGRGVTAEFRLLDPSVSQFHAELCADGVEILISDIGSRNGTRVGSVRINRASVVPSTIVTVGATSLLVELSPAEGAPPEFPTAFGKLLGQSSAMREVFLLLDRLKGTDLPVLIEGETGTGKEVAARAMHAASRRVAGPFVVVDCTTLPSTLAESVLFGHERGAFTGATERRQGLFEAADGGTVFLDEIGELSPELQPKLLGVLERREVMPIGSARARPIDVRVLTATWRDLRMMVNRGTFREDLYYRVAFARVRIPSLSERQEDIGILARAALSRIPSHLPAARNITDEALDLLRLRQFPGNVRELLATVERAALLAEGAVITAQDLAFERTLMNEGSKASPVVQSEGTEAAVEPFKEAKQSIIDEFEQRYIQRLLNRAGANVSRAAALAGISRHSLRDLMRRHGMRSVD